MQDEQWRDVPGFEGRYQVSDLGRVRSIDRVVTMGTRWGGTMTRRFKGTILVPTPDKDGYPRVGLYAAPRLKLARVHILVALAFVPNPENLPQVDHQDSDTTNPVATNLQWTTGQGNMDLMVSRGRSVRGSNHPKAKLSAEAVRRLRGRAAAGESYIDLSTEFGVSDVTVRNAVRGVTWKHA